MVGGGIGDDPGLGEDGAIAPWYCETAMALAWEPDIDECDGEYGGGFGSRRGREESPA